MVTCLAATTCVVTVPGLLATKSTVMPGHSLPSVNPQPREASLCSSARGHQRNSYEEEQVQPFGIFLNFFYNLLTGTYLHQVPLNGNGHTES